MGPNHLQGKKKFSVPTSSKGISKCINGQINHSKYGETGVPCALDAIFEQYKNTMKGNQDVSAPNDSDEVSVSITDDVRTSRKRGLTEAFMRSSLVLIFFDNIHFRVSELVPVTNIDAQ
ncbi:hypothetical protein BC332_31379 [Capsicum chinense]|nr:hypothetical protein BC332_31379 [Capsicum chinense]